MPLRIVIAKAGLDGHDRGARIVSRALRDAGMEVIYTGLHETPEQIVRTALDEDADVIGLSIHSGAHMTLFASILRLLEVSDACDITVIGGGIVPTPDVERLRSIGVKEIFGPGSTTSQVVTWIQDHCTQRAVH